MGNIKVEVFKRVFPDTEAGKYEWHTRGQCVSAGLDDIKETIADIAQTIGKGNEIFVHSPPRKKDSENSALVHISPKDMDELLKHFHPTTVSIEKMARRGLPPEDLYLIEI